MDVREVLKHLDHTELLQTATHDDIVNLCDDALHYGAASVCVPPSYVKCASARLAGRLPVCTVIGFPHGYNTTSCKIFEAKEALENGADELDMVINIGWVKDGLYSQVEDEIRALKAVAGDHVLKVIIETGLLTDEEKIRMCEVVTRAGADYIKTCTGYAAGKAEPHDIALFKQHIGPHVKIKASSGMTSIQQGADFVAMGCNRLGSRLFIRFARELDVE
ncbi:MAG: deoxyribose-phosphate aldolase [Candidatus Pelethousia sp.]|nr:deoxyribose-phosphate aldolase [Candidatus Pelethousia sp.]